MTRHRRRAGGERTTPSPPTVPPVALGLWRADPDRSTVGFSLRHVGASRARGRFTCFSVSLSVEPALEQCSLDAAIDLSSVWTGDEARDRFLHSTPFFGQVHRPTMTFGSTCIRAVTAADWQVEGTLELNGVQRDKTLQARVLDPARTPSDSFTCWCVGTLRRRAEYGIDFGSLPIGPDRLLLGDTVAFELAMTFVRCTEDRRTCVTSSPRATGPGETFR
jgi:polyisoprenoid-binding protein YceI